MEKTLGGDRLGSGKKMKVHLHGYERSTHDLGYVWRSTMSSGTLVPFLHKIGLPGDTFDINLGCDIKTHPTIGPLFGSYKVQLDIFQAPLRLYNSKLHNNALGIGRNMSTIKLPQVELRAVKFDITDETDLDNVQINPSALISYLGIRGVGIKMDGAEDSFLIRMFNAVPILAYWEIYKNYYANKQEEIGALIHTPAVTLITTIDSITLLGNGDIQEAPVISIILVQTGDLFSILFTGAQPIPNQTIVNTVEHGEMKLDEFLHTITLVAPGELQGYYNNARWGNEINIINRRYINGQDLNNGKPQVTTFPLVNIDNAREAILAAPGTTVLVLNADTNYLPYLASYGISGDGIPYNLSTQQGLGLKTYQSDLFNNWLKTENIQDITDATAIDTTGGSFTLDQLNLSRKVYNMLNRINVSGGSYDDWLDAVYDHDRYMRCESPMYMGGLIKELVFQEVVSNSVGTGDEGEQPLGTLAGRGILASKHKGGSIVIKVDEPSYIIGIISLTPRVDYSQGNAWDVTLKTMDDLHKPALDEIGFQELITEQMAWWDTTAGGGIFTQKSAGKQPAWLNYMTSVNETHGNFAIGRGKIGEMFMTLNRRYENNLDLGIKDLTTYIDPSKFNFIFAETQLDAQNFWAQIAVDITARRKMSAKIMPNL